MNVVESDIGQTLPIEPQRKYPVYDWYLNLKTQTLRCDSEVLALLLDSQVEQLSAKTFFDLLPKSQRTVIKKAFQSVLDSGQSKYTHCCLLAKTSLFIYSDIYIERVSSYELKGTISPCLNISNKNDIAEIFYSVFENAHHGIVVTDSETRILACNHHFESLTGYLRNEIVGLKTQIFNAERHSQAYYQQLWNQVAEQGHWSGTILSRRADGSVFPQDLTIHRITPGNGETYYLGLSSDLSLELDRLEDIASGGIDLLTQLPNKETFLQQLNGLCRQAEMGKSLVVLALQPKFVGGNLQEQKRQFASYLRDNTKVLASGYLGHDCFAVCIDFVFQQDSQVVTNIGRAITKLFHSFKHAQSSVAKALKEGVTGVSVLSIDAATPNQLVSHAYQALLELHSGHARRINFYDRDIHQQVDRRKQLEEHVLSSLNQGRIDVVFQPIVDLKQQRIDKFEALCRFPHHASLKTNTQELVAVVEELDKVVELDDLVLLKALQYLPELQRRFGEHVQLSVNRSLKTTTSLTTILQQAAMTLDTQRINPAQITFEFTESAYFEADEKNIELLAALREAGVTIAVDDFGTGCSSFRYLKERYFDILKIDRAFIQNITYQSRQYNIVMALIQLAKRLGLDVIAEGVETEQELEILSKLGADYIQGYYFSKPLPIEQLTDVADHFSLANPSAPLPSDCMMQLAEPGHHIDPGEPLSLVFQYFSQGKSDYLPVVDGKECVGYIDRAHMNLHLTPGMGTDWESSKESSYWHKPANRIMSHVQTELAWQTPKAQVAELVVSQTPFPWCLVDEDGHFKGLVGERMVMAYLANNISIT
ncbi:MAG: EAL domain-containing protein [Pseudomonadota bacterium]